MALIFKGNHSYILFLLFQSLFGVYGRAQATKPSEGVQKVLTVANQLLEESEASYVYGGHKVGSREECLSCAQCLETKVPNPKKRLVLCPMCQKCGIDCSHFVALVFAKAGFEIPYLDTSLMLDLKPHHLAARYSLWEVPLLSDLRPGDLLVYDGHVVLLEKRHRPVAGLAPLRGDVIHATGGKAIRTPGQGIQRERFVDLTQFRGPLRRILRHTKLSQGSSS